MSHLEVTPTFLKEKTERTIIDHLISKTWRIHTKNVRHPLHCLYREFKFKHVLNIISLFLQETQNSFPMLYEICRSGYVKFSIISILALFLVENEPEEVLLEVQTEPSEQNSHFE